MSVQITASLQDVGVAELRLSRESGAGSVCEKDRTEGNPKSKQGPLALPIKVDTPRPVRQPREDPDHRGAMQKAPETQFSIS